MVRKGKQRSTFYVVSFKLNEKDYKKIEQIKKIAKAKGLKLNKVLVFAMSSYFGLKDCPQEEDKEFEQRKEQKNEKSTSTFEQNISFHENENLKKVENLPKDLSPDLPSFFHANPWISILSERK
jgi:hypothetical protein